MPRRSTPATVTPSQTILPWPGVEAVCPKCNGERQVYYRHARHPGVAIAGGKRVICTACAGEGTVRSPVQR